MSQRVAGKVALVTGAARGQGRSHCIRLAEEGADIIAVDICDRIDTVTSYEPPTLADLEETAEAVRRHGRRVVVRQLDVRDLGALEAAVTHGIAVLGGLDVVVANAGIAEFGRAWELAEAQWRELIDINLTGAWLTARACVPHMIEAGKGGSIVFTGSLASEKGVANLAHYVAAKHGVQGLMRALAIELGPHFIRVNSVNPTNVDTPMIQHPTLWRLFVPGVNEPAQADVREAMKGQNAMPIPWVDPIDVSNAVLFLASDEARYISGAALPVDAGAGAK